MARPNANRRIFLIMEGKSLYIIITITSMKFVGTPEPNSLISFFLPNRANHIIKRPHKIKMMEKILYPIECHPFPHRLNDIVIIILTFNFKMNSSTSLPLACEYPLSSSNLSNPHFSSTRMDARLSLAARA